MNAPVAELYNPLLLPEIREMLAEKDDRALAEVMTELHSVSIAEFAEGLSVDETWQLLSHADIYRQAEVFSSFSLHKQEGLVSGVGRERMSKLLEAMSHDDRVDLLKRLDQDIVDSLLPLVAKADREDIKRLLSYPEHSAGSVMTTDYATLPPDIPVSEAISRVRHEAPHKETIYYVFVVDQDRRLVGLVSLRELILAKPTALISDIMQRETISVRVDQDQEEAAKELAKYDFIAIPVVDDQYRLVGIITHDDVIDVVVEEATEDALRMGGVTPMVEHYLDVPFETVWRKRSLWLACLFGAELLTFTAMASFEGAIAQITVLALFVPLCISTGGNSGSQAATLITRAMAVGHIAPANRARVLRHELLMGLALGLTLGVIGFARGALTPKNVLEGHKATEGQAASDSEKDPAAGASEKYNLDPKVLSEPGVLKEVQRAIESSSLTDVQKATLLHEQKQPSVSPWTMGTVISLAVASICLWGTLIGSMLPLAFRQLGFDPGYASSPFVATFVDVTGIIIYFSIAKIFLL